MTSPATGLSRQPRLSCISSPFVLVGGTRDLGDSNPCIMVGSHAPHPSVKVPSRLLRTISRTSPTDRPGGPASPAAARKARESNSETCYRQPLSGRSASPVADLPWYFQMKLAAPYDSQKQRSTVRHGPESNWRVAGLQSAGLPLAYRAVAPAVARDYAGEHCEPSAVTRRYAEEVVSGRPFRFP